MTTISLAQPEIVQPSRLTLALRYLRRNKGLAIGSFILLLLVIFTVYGQLTTHFQLKANNLQACSTR
jgi:hypothetical protein